MFNKRDQRPLSEQNKINQTKYWIRWVVWVLLFLAFMLPVNSLAQAPVSDDPLPQSEVVFSGNNDDHAGFLPGETVLVEVKGPGQFLTSCNAVVSATGSWSCVVNLWQQSQVLGQFTYKARGLSSGVGFLGTFTNTGAIQAVRLFDHGEEIFLNATLYPGGVLEARVKVSTTQQNFSWGSSRYQVQEQVCGPDADCEWLQVYFSDCLSSPNPDLKGQVSDKEIIFRDLFQPAESGASYRLLFTTFSDGKCLRDNGGQWNTSPSFTYSLNTTQTSLTCIKSDDETSVSQQCEATVKRVTGSQGTPAGDVNFIVEEPGVGVFHSESCVLTPSGTDSGVCSVTYTPLQPGSHSLQAEYRGDEQENLNSVSDTLVVRSDLLLPVLSLAANNLTKTYGDEDPPLTFTYQPAGAELNISGGLARESGEDAGTYTITLGNLRAEGYQIEFIPAVLTISKATPIITVEPFRGTYDGTFHGLSGIARGVKGEDLGSLLDLGSSYKDAPGGLTNWSFSGNDNYFPIQGEPQMVTILPRELEITADVLIKTYGDPDPEFTYQITGGDLVPGDLINGRIYRSPVETVGLYALDISHLTAGENYRLARVSAWFRILPRTITAVADPQRVEINADLPPLSYHLSEGLLAPGDAFSGILGRQPIFGKGLYTITQGTLTLTPNYALRFVPASLEVFDPAGGADEDGDGVVNIIDNCGYFINPAQEDEDGDGFGDACDNADDRLFTGLILPVTGETGSISVDCDSPVSLGLVDGSSVNIITDQCGLTGTFRMEAIESLPKPPPTGSAYLGGVSLNLTNGSNEIDTLPRASTITYSLPISAGLSRSDWEVYYWDPNLDMGLGDWVKLPFFVAIRGEPIVFPLYRGGEKVILSGVKQTVSPTLVFQTNFPGLFAVVRK